MIDRHSLYNVFRVVGMGICLSLWLLAAVIPAAAQEPPFHAGLLIVDEEGAVSQYCVAFDAPQIDGLSLLQHAGVQLTLDANSGGTAVCAIDDTGCPGSDCFCACTALPCRYWTYFHASGAGWLYSAQGADSWVLHDGDVDAWVWGDGATAPPEIDFADICDVTASQPEQIRVTPVDSASPTPETSLEASAGTPTATQALPETAVSVTESASASPRWLNYAFFVTLLIALLGGFIFMKNHR